MTSPAYPFPDTDLFSPEVRDTYEGAFLAQCAFPLGGIGTGCISLSGTGQLVDWEIFNEANKGFRPWMTFLCVWTKRGEETAFKVLEGQIPGNLTGRQYVPDARLQGEGHGIGPHQVHANGLPRFRECKMVARFPFARVELADPVVPLSVTVEGWSPFIPGNSRESSLPVAVLNVTLANPASAPAPVEAVVGVNVQNPFGATAELRQGTGGAGETSQTGETGGSLLYMHAGDPAGNSLFVASPRSPDSVLLHWPGVHRFIAFEHFRRTFATTGRFEPLALDIAGEAEQPAWVRDTDKEQMKIASIGYRVTVAPGDRVTVPVVLGWYVPVFRKWRHYYATEWGSGLEVAEYALAHLARLEDESRQFQAAFFSSTLPGTVLEAASTNLCVLRSPTVIRYPEGTLYGWEGCLYNRRLGEGTCNHVWHYQQAVPFLFPDLQRLVLENFFFNGQDPATGALKYRMPVEPPAHRDPTNYDEVEEEGLTWADLLAHVRAKQNFFTAADGQLGQVCQVYREWQLSGDDEWLAAIWPATRKALEYAWRAWDPDKDGLLEGTHHTTLDLNLNTPDSWCGSIYLAALLAGERMALEMDDVAAAREYRHVFESGRRLTEERLFNGAYFQQATPTTGALQYGAGCEIDQVHGQLYARVLGLEDVLDPAKVRTALKSLYAHNYQAEFYDFFNVNRVYAVGDDRGLVIATWPRGERPRAPLLYCDEVMEGFEYQAAHNMIYAGLVREGLTVIRSIRDRYNGQNRNPFNEFEWGSHYARSLASYGGVLALSGFRYSAPSGLLVLDPKLHQDNFRVFFSVEGAWGVVTQEETPDAFQFRVEVQAGSLALSRVRVNTQHPARDARARLGDATVQVILQEREAAPNRECQFEGTLAVTPAAPLTLTIRAREDG